MYLKHTCCLAQPEFPQYFPIKDQVTGINVYSFLYKCGCSNSIGFMFISKNECRGYVCIQGFSCLSEGGQLSELFVRMGLLSGSLLCYLLILLK